MSSQSKKIDEKIKTLEEVIEKLRIQAKENLAKSQASKGAQKQLYKNKAVMALNKKKQYETQLGTLLNHHLTIQKLHLTTQSIKNHQQLMTTMQHTITEQKKAMQKVDVDKMEDLRDEMMDLKFQAEYVNQMLARDYDVGIDQDELDGELEEFQREIAMDKKKAVNINTNTNNNKPQTNTQTNYKNQDIESMLKGL